MQKMKLTCFYKWFHLTRDLYFLLIPKKNQKTKNKRSTLKFPVKNNPVSSGLRVSFSLTWVFSSKYSIILSSKFCLSSSPNGVWCKGSPWPWEGAKGSPAQQLISESYPVFLLIPWWSATTGTTFNCWILSTPRAWVPFPTLIMP